MMEQVKLSTIRLKVREAFKKSDDEVAALLDRQIEDFGKPTKQNLAEIETLRLLRDALLKEITQSVTKSKKRKVAAVKKLRL